MLSFNSTHYDAERREWSGPKRKPLFNDALTLGELIYDVLNKNPKKIIQIYDVTGETMTCEELLNYAEKLSKYLLMELGLKVGDVIGLYSDNNTHVVTVMLASFFCGTPVNPINDRDTVRTIFDVSRPKIVFCDMDNFETIRRVNEELNLGAQICVLNGNVEGATNIRDLLRTKLSKECQNFRYPCVDLDGDSTAAIVSSSGTTGTPKGILCSNRALFNQNILLDPSTNVVFAFSHMYWLSGLWTLIASLTNGCLRVVTDKQFTSEYLLYLIKRYKITHLIVNPVHMREITLLKDIDKTRESLASIDSIWVGGGTVPLVTQEKVHHILSGNPGKPGLVIDYGMSELGGGLTYNSTYLNDNLLGSEGFLTPNNKVKIVNKNNEMLGPNEHGEICFSTIYTWFGYYKNEEATRKVKRGDWVHTGDIGYFDNDGCLHVCTRDVDVFDAGSFQIYPQILEDVIMRLKGVFEVCVFGIPDAIASNLTACAVIRTSDDAGLNLKAEDIHQFVKENIGPMYNLSGGVYFVDAIPQTGTGKIQRFKLLPMVMKMKEQCV